MRERAAALRADPARVEAILRDGARRARAIAQATLTEVKRRMGFYVLPERPSD
jgi:tryptophanyl-tRNA synthetase